VTSNDRGWKGHGLNHLAPNVLIWFNSLWRTSWYRHFRSSSIWNIFRLEGLQDFHFMLEINAGSDRGKTTNAQQATCSPKIQAILSFILSHFMNLTLIAAFFLKSVVLYLDLCNSLSSWTSVTVFFRKFAPTGQPLANTCMHNCTFGKIL